MSRSNKPSWDYSTKKNSRIRYKTGEESRNNSIDKIPKKMDLSKDSKQCLLNQTQPKFVVKMSKAQKAKSIRSQSSVNSGLFDKIANKHLKFDQDYSLAEAPASIQTQRTLFEKEAQKRTEESLESPFVRQKAPKKKVKQRRESPDKNNRYASSKKEAKQKISDCQVQGEGLISFQPVKSEYETNNNSNFQRGSKVNNTMSFSESESHMKEADRSQPDNNGDDQFGKLRKLSNFSKSTLQNAQNDSRREIDVPDLAVDKNSFGKIFQLRNGVGNHNNEDGDENESGRDQQKSQRSKISNIQRVQTVIKDMVSDKSQKDNLIDFSGVKEKQLNYSSQKQQQQQKNNQDSKKRSHKKSQKISKNPKNEVSEDLSSLLASKNAKNKKSQVKKDRKSSRNLQGVDKISSRNATASQEALNPLNNNTPLSITTTKYPEGVTKSLSISNQKLLDLQQDMEAAQSELSAIEDYNWAEIISKRDQNEASRNIVVESPMKANKNSLKNRISEIIPEETCSNFDSVELNYSNPALRTSNLGKKSSDLKEVNADNSANGSTGNKNSSLGTSKNGENTQGGDSTSSKKFSSTSKNIFSRKPPQLQSKNRRADSIDHKKKSSPNQKPQMRNSMVESQNDSRVRGLGLRSSNISRNDSSNSKQYSQYSQQYSQQQQQQSQMSNSRTSKRPSIQITRKAYRVGDHLSSSIRGSMMLNDSNFDLSQSMIAEELADYHNQAELEAQNKTNGSMNSSLVMQYNHQDEDVNFFNEPLSLTQKNGRSLRDTSGLRYRSNHKRKLNTSQDYVDESEQKKYFSSQHRSSIAFQPSRQNQQRKNIYTRSNSVMMKPGQKFIQNQKFSKKVIPFVSNTTANNTTAGSNSRSNINADMNMRGSDIIDHNTSISTEQVKQERFQKISGSNPRSRMSIYNKRITISSKDLQSIVPLRSDMTPEEIIEELQALANRIKSQS